jgi:hypothetical protein
MQPPPERPSREERCRQRARWFTENLPAARDLLVRLGARRVFLFGSLATGSVTETSDVDLAVEGLPREAYLEALGGLMALFRAAVDLVRLEGAPDKLLERVHGEGREL